VGAAGAVVVLEFPLDHPRDDLHLLVSLLDESGSAPEAVVVAGQQEAVVRVVGVVVPAEAEAVPGIEPAGLGPEARPGPDDLDGRGEDRGPHALFLDRKP
jgi:hypothetical protein